MGVSNFKNMGFRNNFKGFDSLLTQLSGLNMGGKKWSNKLIL